jgi:hypothetical protein
LTTGLVSRPTTTCRSWKRDCNNVATLSAEEPARRRCEFDAQKEIARGLRESAA